MKKSEKRSEKRIQFIWRFLVIGSIILTLILTALYLFRLETPTSISSKIDPAIFGQYGDLIGGLVGTLLTGLSAYLIYMTYKSQKDELKATQDALYDQKDETAVFTMLSTLREIVTEMKGSVLIVGQTGHSGVKEFSGRAYFHEATKFSRSQFAYENLPSPLMFNPGTGKLHEFNEVPTGIRNDAGNEQIKKIPLETPGVNVEMTIPEIVAGFENSFRDHEHNFDHYFRYVRNIVEFIEDIPVPEYKELYFKIFKAQLSLDEQVMIFYYALSIKDDIMFHYYVDSSGILSDITQRKKLFDDWHYLFYPLTDFRFLSEAEIKDKRDYIKKLNRKKSRKRS